MVTTLERLQDAAVMLAQNGPLKERLAHAWQRHLAGIDAAMLPDTARAEFRGLCEALGRERPLPRENPAVASIRKMSTEEAGRHAAFVIRLYATVACGGEFEAFAARQPMRGSVVPLFAEG